MGRPVTLFTGQWADLTLDTLAGKAAAWGFDGLELACWGDHFEGHKALADPGYVKRRWEILKRHGLKCWAISNHLVGHAVCDPRDNRPTGDPPPDVQGGGDGFGINFDPSHFAHQFLDSAAFVMEFADRIYHVHVKDSKKLLDGHRSILGSHIDFGEPDRGWTFVSPGHGDVDFESLIRALNRIGYDGPLSIEWEASGMDGDWGAPDALAMVRRTDFAPSSVAFDAAFKKG